MYFPTILLVFTALFRISNTQINVSAFITKRIADNQVSFDLYNRNNSLIPITLSLENLHNIETDTEVKFLIHGFFENSENSWYRDITVEYLKKSNYSIIQVDWSKPASSTYVIASWNTHGVGRIIGKLIAKLHKNYGISLDKFHLIGHSLGAHVAGYAGKEVIKRTGSPIFRITALDAAGPLFEGPNLMFEGLTKDDADIVDAIHTDGGMFGRNNIIGDADFFPNGGVAPQPGCDFIQILLPANNFVEFRREVFCSHTKSYYYFIASINQETFIGNKCTSWKEYQQGACYETTTAIMGENYELSDTTGGTFFLKTNARSPFAKN